MDIRYIELKTGYNDNGPAWIGNVKESKSGKTIYFNDHAFQKYHGVFSNYIDIETGDEYWISRVKKNGEDRYWAGSGKITIKHCGDWQRNMALVVMEYGVINS